MTAAGGPGWLRRRRLGPLGGSALSGLLLPALAPLVSLLVVRLASVELWGAFVPCLIAVQLAVHLSAWGNRDFVLRALARTPAAGGALWRSSLVTRAPLLLLLPAALLAVGVPAGRVVLLVLWAAAAFVQQAHDAVVAARRRFATAAAVEAAGVAATAGLLAARGAALDLDALVAAFAAVAAVKAAVLAVLFRRTTLDGAAWRVDAALLVSSLPFVALGAAGMVQSRADLWMVAAFLPGREVGTYQVLLALAVWLQTLPAVLLAPSLRALYRTRRGLLESLAPRLFVVGLAVAPPYLLAVDLALRRLWRIDVAALDLVLVGLLALPAWATVPRVYALSRADGQRRVVAITLAGAALNLALAAALLPRLGITGALAGAATAQWAMLAAYLMPLGAARPAAACRADRAGLPSAVDAARDDVRH